MTDFSGLYHVRPGNIDDKNFIMATFLRSLYHGDSWFSLIPKKVFMANYHKIAEAILSSPNTVVRVACLPDDASVIIGYSILTVDLETIQWVYVKSAWRRRGIARSLVPPRTTAVTHLSIVGKSLLNKFPNAIFNPFYTP